MILKIASSARLPGKTRAEIKMFVSKTTFNSLDIPSGA
jgi:hypothetical protein